ncbi:MAG TPA: FAD-binding oxidoreductase [Steroidobacteraceae bacterium]|nr:FAD-binding oxidoreductase [Steroidobacteraceae bacterium]
MPHIVSYYAASANPAPDRPVLEGSRTADVCVIGGGIAGCSTALELAERGYDVVLLEAERIAWGASGRSGGQAIFGFGTSMETLVRQVGQDDARRMWDVSIEALDLLRERVARHEIDCDLHWGQMHVGVRPRHRDELRAWHEEMEQLYGYTGLQFLEREDVERVIATRRYNSGLFDPRSGHLHPLNYTLGLAAAAERAGARLFEGSRVTRIDQGSTVRVVTARGEVSARFVAVCCNAYIEELIPSVRARIMPVGTYIVATEPLGEERITSLVRQNIGVTDICWVLDYFRRSADHRLLFGGRVSYSGLDPLNTRGATRSRMIKVFPQLADVQIEYAWGGWLDVSMNRAPDFNRVGPNIYYVQGFSGHGIALTGMAGRLMAEAIHGQAERFDLFARLQHRDFPGGRAFRTPLLVLAMLWYRLRDLV